MRTLLIDNYDSFTYNLFQALGRVCGHEPVVLRNDDLDGLKRLDLSQVDAIVVSPGPGSPERERDFGISRWAVEQADLPVLGICLGHQGLCLAAGATVARAPEPMHGRLSEIHHDGDPLFDGIPSPFQAVRYHSLAVYDLPDEVRPIAHTADGILMGVRHHNRPHWGVQFHPESIETAHGERLLANFRDLVCADDVAPAASAALSRRPMPATQYSLSVREVSCPDAESAFEELFAGEPGAYWLDSSRLIPGLSRFSILGAASGPLAEIVSSRVDTGEVVVTRPDGTQISSHAEQVFSYIERMLAARRIPDAGLACGFNLGYVGYLGYELKAECGGDAVHTSPLPDACMVFSDRALVIDHEERRAWLLALSTPEYPATVWLHGAAWALVSTGTLAPPELPPVGEEELAVSARYAPSDYAKLILECQREIAAGESYEICLTNLLTVPVTIDPWRTYRVLRRLNPAPYGAFLRMPGFSVLSTSPERFLSIDVAGEAESKPIKGTRPRGQSAEEDERFVADLRGSEKERAENLMIVDLVRNDIGRVARLGSVHVPVLYGVESYQTVHQLVSTIRGQLDAGCSPVACVRASFPGGSMTGAPKLRTMEIIDRLEDGVRGVYSGALGYLSLNGAVDLSIVIRTMVATEDSVTIGVGGAITALSDPEDEIEETWVKARALMHVLAQVCGARQPQSLC